MKKFILFALSLLGAELSIQAQECKDVIYTLEWGNIISNCCILEVRDGNMVTYIKRGDTLKIAAAAITRDGKYFNLRDKATPEEDQYVLPEEPRTLYKGHDYNYYQGLAKKATSQRRIGITMTVAGLGAVICGYILASSQTVSGDYKTFGAYLFFGGGIVHLVGIPILFTGAAKEKNNNKAMEEIQRNMSVTFGMTTTGPGLAFRF